MASQEGKIYCTHGTGNKFFDLINQMELVTCVSGRVLHEKGEYVTNEELDELYGAYCETFVTDGDIDIEFVVSQFVGIEEE